MSFLLALVVKRLLFEVAFNFVKKIKVKISVVLLVGLILAMALFAARF